MKTKFNLLCIITVMMLGFNLKSKAQTYPLTNLLLCDVKIFYEMWDSNCNVCSNGSILVTQGSTVNLTQCGGFFGLCIVITDIGGTSIAANHSSSSSCHPVAPSGQSGTNPSGCYSGTSWTATQTGTGWIIQ